MKKFFALTISLGIALSSLAFGGTSALADDSLSAYPKSFIEEYTPENFKDYALNAAAAAFAVGDKIFVYDGGDEGWQSETAECERTIYEFDSNVTALDCVDGTFICTVAGNDTVYALIGDGETEASELPFNTFLLNHPCDDGYTYDIEDGDLCLWLPGKNEKVIREGDFANFKYYGGAYFTNGGRLTIVSEGEPEPVGQINYIDFTPAGGLAIGDAAESLQTISGNLDFVTVNGGFYATPVDLDNLSGETFKVDDPDETFSTDSLKNKVALRLYAREGLAIISIEDNAYALHPDALNEFNSGLTEETVGAHANIADDCNPYSLPFISDGTKLSDGLSGGMEVWIVSRVHSDELQHDFYLISYTDDHEEYIGYVPTGHVTSFHFNEDSPQNIPDPAPDNSDSVRTVVLILVVVALVMAAVGYLTWVATSGKKKASKPKDFNEKQ